MDLHKVLLFVLATIVSFLVRLRSLADQFVHAKDLSFHYAWLFLYKFLPKRRFVLDRLPRHVALSIIDDYKDENSTTIMDDEIDSGALARLIVWCGRYGVEKVSVYDWRGLVARPRQTKLLANSVMDQLSTTTSTRKNESMEEEEHYQQQQNVRFTVNGVDYNKSDHDEDGSKSQSTTTRQRTLELITLDWRAGRRGIVEAARSLGADIRTGKLDATNWTSNEFADALNKYSASNGGITPPDLLIELGAIGAGDSTCGYPPLVLRVVEVIKVGDYRTVDELAFLECLEKYSQRDRRFGK